MNQIYTILIININRKNRYERVLRIKIECLKILQYKPKGRRGLGRPKKT
jgi:hypothetical protein